MTEQTYMKNGFRLRGREMTRLETFLDAAFAFAMTMLVISIGDIPNNFQELTNALKGVPAFAASFASILTFWAGHRKWSRAYGFEDGPTVLISLVMVFILLVYIYPLRMVFNALFAWITGGWIVAEFTLRSGEELALLFVIYGIGFTALAATMILLYWRALKVSLEIPLDALERLRTRSEIASWTVLAATAFVSTLFALIMPVHIGIFAGFTYATLPFTMTTVSTVYKSKEKSFLQADAAAEEHSQDV